MSFGMVMQKYGKNANLCYMDADSFIVYIKAYDIYEEIPEDVETRFDTSNDELDRALPKRKKVIGSIKDELGGKIVRKTYSYLIDDSSKDKKAKAQKSVSKKIKT